LNQKITVVKKGTNIVERLIWLVCIAAGIYGIIFLGLATWDRYVNYEIKSL
jgi:hypothetical protein